MAHWGVGDPSLHRGGLTERKPRSPAREVTLVQRKTTPIGIGPRQDSGWAHRAVLKQCGVRQVRGATYVRVDDAGLHLLVDGAPGAAGGRHRRGVRGPGVGPRAVRRPGRRPARPAHLIGGADVAAELDAKRAIEQGTRVAAAL